MHISAFPLTSMLYKLDCAASLLGPPVLVQKKFFFLVSQTCSELVILSAFTLSVDKFFCL